MTFKGIHIVNKVLANGDTRVYVYAWRGGPRMHADVDDDEAMMLEWLRLTRERPPEPGQRPKALPDLIKAYVASSDFTGLKDRTKIDYKAALDRIEAQFYDLDLASLQQRGARADIRRWRDAEFADRKRTGDLTMTVFNKVLNFGVDQEEILRNPLEKMAKLSAGTRRDMIWSDEQMELFASRAPRHLARAMILAKWTGQRQADLLKLTWKAYDGTYIKLQQGKAGRGKAGKKVKILVSAELRAVLDEIKTEQTARANHKDEKKRRPAPVNILTTERGAPWGSGFKASWAQAVKDTGITGVTFHDLRGTFITLAHRAGVLIKDIAEASGHDEKECERVIRQHYLATGSETVIRSLEAAGGRRKRTAGEQDL